MTRYADPERCPDCRSPIAFRAARCEACGLPLHGPVAQRLFETLSAADALLVELRAGALPAGDHATAPVTAARPAPFTPRRTTLSAASVPQILLTLGAGCVLVAALVFLAVAWSALGVAGRTTVLVVLTVLTGALGGVLARRGLRAAAEALVLVSLGLLTLDVFGADRAGWLGDLEGEGFLVLLGSLLATAAAAAVLAVRRRTEVGSLVGAQLVCGLGVAVAAAGLVDLDQGRTDADLVLTVVLAVLVTEGLRRLRLDVATVVAALVAGMLWLLLVAASSSRVVLHATYRELWLELHVWPALAAAVIAGAAGVVRPLPTTGRVAGVGLGTAVGVGALVAPALAQSATTAVLTVFAVLVPAALLAWFGPRPWGLVAAPTQAVGLLWVSAAAVALAVPGAQRLVGLADGESPSPLPSEPLAPWLLPLCAVALLATVVAVCQASATLDRVVGVLADPRLAAALVALSVVLTAPLLAVPVWLVVTLPLAAGAGFVVWWLRRRALLPLGLAAGFLATGLATGLYSPWLTLAALTVALAAAAVVHVLATGLLGDVAGVVAAACVAALTWTVGDLADARATWTVLVGLLLLAVLGTTGREGLEIGSAASAVPLALGGVVLAPADLVAAWVAVYLTVAGAAVTAVALVRPGRRPAAWAGGLLLAAATWVRLYDVGVREPEAYTLPSALVLCLLGLWQLRRRRESATVPLLGPGLTLALLPSLLWALVEPPGLRALLLGLTCLALVLAGVRVRWTAPVVWGGVAGGLLVLRLAAPYIGDTVPRWLLIGAAGALLIATGVTWERRLREARQMRDYVRGLR